ncbi:MAG: zinc-binding dehydrogenase, partial [Clostridia bacterium]|nr:zinc-binding dehydrogenase [Clostridia bacterium]
DRVRRVRELTGGMGADVVAELAGSAQVVPEGLKMTRTMGRYLEIGNISRGDTYVADPSRLVFGNRTIVGVSLYEPRHLRQAIDFLARTRRRFPFERLLATRFPLERINEAIARQDRREVARASICMEMGEGGGG